MFKFPFSCSIAGEYLSMKPFLYQEIYLRPLDRKLDSVTHSSVVKTAPSLSATSLHLVQKVY